MAQLTRRQREIYEFLCNSQENFSHPPTIDELCQALGLASRGSMHKHITALIEAGLVEPFSGQKRGIRLTESAVQHQQQEKDALPLVGKIAAGRPIEAIEDNQQIVVPEQLKSERPCYVLKVQGDSMVEAGIFDGDWVVIEQRTHARNGEIVVALVEKVEATLKYIQQERDKVMLIPANAKMSAMTYRPDQVEIQGVLIGQMRSYQYQ